MTKKQRRSWSRLGFLLEIGFALIIAFYTNFQYDGPGVYLFSCDSRPLAFLIGCPGTACCIPLCVDHVPTWLYKSGRPNAQYIYRDDATFVTNSNVGQATTTTDDRRVTVVCTGSNFRLCFKKV